MNKSTEPASRRAINWTNLSTVFSAAILIGVEVFGAAYAGGWAIANLFDLGSLGSLALRTLFFVLGLAVMVSFIRGAQRVEPFASRR